MNLQLETDRVLFDNFSVETFKSRNFKNDPVSGEMITIVASKCAVVCEEKVTGNTVIFIANDCVSSNNLPPNLKFLFSY